MPFKPRGSEIRRLRETKLHVKLRTAAETAGISEGYLSRLERNLVTNPSAEVVGRVASTWGVEVGEIFTYVEDGADSEAVAEPEPDPHVPEPELARSA